MDDERKRIRDALADMGAALKEDRDFGPHYTLDDHRNINMTWDKFTRRLEELDQQKESNTNHDTQ